VTIQILISSFVSPELIISENSSFYCLMLGEADEGRTPNTRFFLCGDNQNLAIWIIRFFYGAESTEISNDFLISWMLPITNIISIPTIFFTKFTHLVCRIFKSSTTM